MANILLISYYFPPRNSIPCRRIYGWAKYLKQLGHNVTILTADNPGDKVLNSFSADTSFFDIYRLPYFDLSAIFMRFFKPAVLLAAEPKDKNKKNNRRNFFELILNALNSSFSSRGILLGCTRFPTFFEAWFCKAYAKAKVIIEKHKIEVIITSSPPPTVNLVGLYLKRKFKNILWVSDHRDLWVDNPAHRGLFPFTLFEKFYEKRCLKEADIIIVVSKVMQDIFSKKYPKKESAIFCIENGYDEDIFNGIQTASSNNISKKTIVYCGTLYQDRRNPELLFKVVSQNYMRFKERLEIIFYGNYETKRILNKFFNVYPLAKDVIQYGGFISSQEILKEQSRADAMLFLENDTCDDGVISGKIFEYLMFKKPILCIGISAYSCIGKLLEKTGLCIFCGNDSKKIEENIGLLLENRIKIEPNEGYIKNFSRKNQVVRLDSIIKENLKKV